jgi:hypothetical protein
METVMFLDILDDFLEAAFLAGGKSEFKLRIIESARYAVEHGDDWRDVLDSLVRNRPEFFSEREALCRQRKAKSNSRLDRQEESSHGNFLCETVEKPKWRKDELSGKARNAARSRRRTAHTER